MKIVVIDGQGGNIGRQLVKLISERFPNEELSAIGTNSIATSNMLKGGNVNAATGENPVIVACRQADIIVGPIGLLIADSLMGEVTPAMAIAIGQSNAVRVLIPMSRCHTQIAGVQNTSATDLLNDAMQKISAIIGSQM